VRRKTGELQGFASAQAQRQHPIACLRQADGGCWNIKPAQLLSLSNLITVCTSETRGP
jgi:hypothetical protein